MIEEWKNAINYNGLYQVSNLGRIRNAKGKIIKQYKDHKGYLITQLTNGKTSKTIRVHRLIAMTFIPNVKNKAQVNHINCNKADNRIENLEWVTNNENKIHAKQHGLCKSSIKGEKNKKAKRVNQYNLDGKLVKKWNCMNDIARSFNVKTVSNISACCKHKKIVDKNGKTYYCRTAYGYKWEYEEEN